MACARAATWGYSFGGGGGAWTGPEYKYFGIPDSGLHGVSHWTRVACYAVYIMEKLIAHHPEGCPTVRACALSIYEKEMILDMGVEQILCHYILIPTALRYGDRIQQEKTFPKSLDVDPDANLVTISVCNGDRLDRVRLCENPNPEKMYPDHGAWKELLAVARQFTAEVTNQSLSGIFSPQQTDTH
ncbi:hypothetical protein Pelo_12901 [Pelomyxa schiedti]|nr:hypothetical protein Pelo_12901 [Pelomyxa schiedti]